MVNATYVSEALPTTEIYTLSLHDALPISQAKNKVVIVADPKECSFQFNPTRSEEHTSELQSLRHLVCRLLLDKKNAQQAASWRALPANSERCKMIWKIVAAYKLAVALLGR